MLRGLAAVWGGVGHVYGRMFSYVGVNLLWLVCSLPIVTAPAAWAGLCRFSYHALRHPTADISEYWAGFRATLGRGLVIGVINVVLVITSVSNLIAYPARDNDPLIAVLRIAWIMLPVIWFALQLYVFALLPALERPTLIGAYRNAAIMVILNPFYTLVIWISAGLLIALSVVFPLVLALLTGALLAGIANFAVLDRLQAAGIVQKPTAAAPGSLADFEGYS